jgi:hypothetical protein
VAELHKLTEVSMVKAREALAVSNNDVSIVLALLQNDLAVSASVISSERCFRCFQMQSRGEHLFT